LHNNTGASAITLIGAGTSTSEPSAQSQQNCYNEARPLRFGQTPTTDGSPGTPSRPAPGTPGDGSGATAGATPGMHGWVESSDEYLHCGQFASTFNATNLNKSQQISTNLNNIQVDEPISM
jgi:hypothetical protein